MWCLSSPSATATSNTLTLTLTPTLNLTRTLTLTLTLTLTSTLPLTQPRCYYNFAAKYKLKRMGVVMDEVLAFLGNMPWWAARPERHATPCTSNLQPGLPSLQPLCASTLQPRVPSLRPVCVLPAAPLYSTHVTCCRHVLFFM